MRNFFINLTVATAVAMAVFLIGFSSGLVRNSFDQTLPQTINIGEVSLLVNNGELIKSYASVPLPNPPTVLGLLETVGEQERFTTEVDRSSSMGAFVKKIGDKVNGQNQMYWQYYVNGSQPQVAADKFILQGGETVLWTFSASEL